MARPFDAAPPEQASSNASAEARLPEPMPLPDPEGTLSLSVPGFPPLELPSEADVGIGIAVEEHPDLPERVPPKKIDKQVLQELKSIKKRYDEKMIIQSTWAVVIIFLSILTLIPT